VPVGWSRADLEPLVFARSGWSCDLCRMYLPGRAYSLQHRRARGAGGRRGGVLDTPWNLILMCGSATTGCHGWVEQTGEGRRWGQDHGFVIRGEARDPASVPMFRHRRDWVIPSVDEHGAGVWLPAEPEGVLT